MRYSLDNAKLFFKDSALVVVNLTHMSTSCCRISEKPSLEMRTR